MNHHRINTEARRKIEERREREDSAPRLGAQVPSLVALRFEIDTGHYKYAWPIVVARAPALFDIACDDQDCKDGGHSVTWSVLSALRAHVADLKGEDVCQGQVRSGSCGRVMRYVAKATYKDPA